MRVLSPKQPSGNPRPASRGTLPSAFPRSGPPHGCSLQGSALPAAPVPISRALRRWPAWRSPLETGAKQPQRQQHRGQGPPVLTGQSILPAMFPGREGAGGALQPTPPAAGQSRKEPRVGPKPRPTILHRGRVSVRTALQRKVRRGRDHSQGPWHWSRAPSQMGARCGLKAELLVAWRLSRFSKARQPPRAPSTLDPVQGHCDGSAKRRTNSMNTPHRSPEFTDQP